MDFFNVGPWEITAILIIAILLIGPKRMVEIVRTLGRVTSQLRRLSNEFTSTLQAEVLAPEREDQPSSNVIEGVTKPIASIRDELADATANIQAEFQAMERETRHVLESHVQDGPGGEAG